MAGRLLCKIGAWTGDEADFLEPGQGWWTPDGQSMTRSLDLAVATDATDYSRSYTAHSFVPFYAQRICSACVMHGAAAILRGIRMAGHSRIRSVAARA